MIETQRAVRETWRAMVDFGFSPTGERGAMMGPGSRRVPPAGGIAARR